MRESLLNADDGWNITPIWQGITLHKKHSPAPWDSAINLKVLASDLLKTSLRERKDECECVCVFWRGVCGGASKFWLRWPSSRASWISNAAFVSSPGNTIKGPINFQPEVWRSSGQHTHTHTPSSPSHMIAALSRVLMRRRAAEVNKLMHHQNTPGQLEVKCAASPRADKLAVYTWKTSPLFLFFRCQKAQWHPRLQTKERFIQEVFLFIETLVALHSSNLQWQIPSHTWKWSKDSEPLWKADTNLPHLEFLFTLHAAAPPEKSQKHGADIPELHVQRHPNAHPPPPVSPGTITWPRHYHCNVGLWAKIGHAVII